MRFLRRGAKEKLFTNLKQHKVEGIRVYHDLTHINIKLLQATRQNERIDSAWVINGSIIAKGLNGLIFQVNMVTDIDQKLDNYNR